MHRILNVLLLLTGAHIANADHPHACGENTGLPIGYSGMFQGFSGNQNG